MTCSLPVSLPPGRAPVTRETGPGGLSFAFYGTNVWVKKMKLILSGCHRVVSELLLFCTRLTIKFFFGTCGIAKFANSVR